MKPKANELQVLKAWEGLDKNGHILRPGDTVLLGDPKLGILLSVYKPRFGRPSSYDLNHPISGRVLVKEFESPEWDVDPKRLEYVKTPLRPYCDEDPNPITLC